jgi:hypothetical protein
MALTLSVPVQKEGKAFGMLGINLAASTQWKEAGTGLSVAVRLIPYRVDEEGRLEPLGEEAIAVVFGDALQESASSPALAECVQAIEAAVQAFVNAMGI